MKKSSIMRIISVVAASVMIITSFATVGATPEAYADGQSYSYDVLVDFSNSDTLVGSGAQASDQYVKIGEKSAYWVQKGTVKKVSFSKVAINDWTAYDKITFDVYSTKATGSNIAMLFKNPKGSNTTQPLFRLNFKLDFEGWKTIEIDLGDAATTSVTPDRTNITSIAFHADGSYSSTYVEGSEVYINSIIGHYGKYPRPEFISDVPDAKEAQMISQLGDCAAAMAFADYAIVNGQKKDVAKADRITTDENGNIAPLTFYSNVLGGSVSQSGGKTTLAYGGASADVSALVVEYNGIKYLPIDAAMTALGKKSTTYEKVTFIGNTGNATHFIDDTYDMMYLKAVLCNKPMSERNITSADWENARDKWKKFLVGDETTDITNPEIAKKITSIENACAYSRNIMNKATTKRVLFGTREVTVTNDMNGQYNRIRDMAIGYATYGSKYYKDPAVLEDIIFALDWGYDNLYGMDEYNGTGWKKTTEFNWWDWHIGVPTKIGEILIILDDDVTQAQVEKWMSCQRAVYQTRLQPENAAGRINVGTLSALLHEDMDLMEELAVDYNRVLYGSDDDGGVREDGLYITHEYYAYTGQYGVSTLMDRMTVLASVLSGTAFEITSPLKHNIMYWMEETFQPAMFNGFMTSTLMGREPGMETAMNSLVLAGVVDMYGTFGYDDDAKLKEMLVRNYNEKNKSSVFTNLNIDRYAKLLSMLEEKIEVEPYVRSKPYYTGDALMHRNGDWGVALQMSSTRIAGWECINGQNLTGWYQGDGRLLTYTDDDPRNYDKTYWSYANPHLVPGTTADDQVRTPASIKDSSKLLAKHDFVGMASIDDLYSTAAMQLETHNWLTEGGNVITDGAGGDAPYHKSSTMAKKAWFMFDDEVVALGADIKESDGHEVRTVLDNKRLNMSSFRMDQVMPDSVTPYEVVSVTASADDGNVPQNMLDGDYGTRWSAEGNQWAVFELKSAVPIGSVGIAMLYSKLPGKVAIFDLETSLDGKTWTTVYSGGNSGSSTSLEAYDMKGVVAKYVRFNGHGRQTAGTGWNSITEFRIYAPAAADSIAVDNRLVTGSETITVDGTVLEKVDEFTKNFTNPKWFHIEDHAGYYLPQGGKLVMNKVTNESYNFLEAWVTHGVSPTSGKYAYVLLPRKTAAETKAYADNSDIVIKSNTPDLQVVEETTLGVKGMVFWKEGTYEGITTSNPMIIMIQNKNGEYKLSISDPTQKLSTATVTISGKWNVKTADARCSIAVNGNNTVITVNMLDANGRPLPVTLVAQ